MKVAAISFALILPLLASCPGVPNPTPHSGYDCAFPPTLKGLVPAANAIAGQYIVVLKKRAAPIQTLMSVQGVTEVKEFKGGYAAKIAQQALQRILSDPNVEYVQADGEKHVKPLAGTPTASWGLDRVDQHDLPLDGDYDPGATGEGVNVAIVDTGISDHPDFEGRLQGDCFSAYGSCTDGFGHGTHVAGTVAAKTWGVAKKANLWASRVLDSNGSGSDSNVIRGIDWVTAKKQAHPEQDWIINMSLGGGDSPALNRATCNALETGVVVVMAAGNESQDADNSSPGRVIQGITVGAEEILLGKDRQASFSNFGPLLDLYAPGVNIESTQPGGTTAVFSGTSMASPHVAGAAALYLARHPGTSAQGVRDGLVIMASSGKLSGLGPGSPDALLYVKAE